MDRSNDKLLLVDDDPGFGAILASIAKSKGFEPQWYSSLLEMGSFARIKEYDVAIIDYYLDCLRGDEIAQYVDTFFAGIPVIIVSSRNFTLQEISRWPSCVRRFVGKEKGAERIIDEARTILKRERLLKHFVSGDLGAYQG